MIRRKNNPGKFSAPKAAKPDRRWTLLLIDSQGKTHTFYRLREAMLIVATLFVIAAALLGLLFYTNWHSASRKIELQMQIDNMQEAVDTLRNEKEILMARLVVAESRVEENFATPAERHSKPETETRAPKKTEPQKASQKASATVAEKVGADDVKIIHDPNVDTLKVNYKVLNQSRKGQRISGRSVVILKPDNDKQKEWLVLPPGPLLNGEPTGGYGKAFSIRNWRTMRFQTPYKKDPYLFKTVMIYVYSTGGELMLEKQLPVGPKAKIIQLALKPSPKEKPAAQKPEEPKRTESSNRTATADSAQNRSNETSRSEESSQTVDETESHQTDGGPSPQQSPAPAPIRQTDDVGPTAKPSDTPTPEPSPTDDQRQDQGQTGSGEPVPGIDY